MQLTRFTDLGLRVLMYLSHPREQPIKVAEIAEQFQVPRNHLIKVVNKLAKLGWVATVRGRNGGLHLAIQPEQLRLSTVIKELEGCKQLIDCDKSYCQLRSSCKLKGILDLGLRAFFKALDEFTLADAVAGKTGAEIIKMHQLYQS